MSANPAPLRLGILCEYGSLLGGEQSLLAVFDNLLPRGAIEPVVFCPPSSPLEGALQQRGVRVAHSIGHVTATSRPEGWNDLLRIADQFNLELLHANSLSMSRRLSRLAPHIRVPCTGHVRDICRLSSAALRDLQQLRGLVAVSHATRDALTEQGLPAGLTEVIYNGVDPRAWAATAPGLSLRAQLNLPPDAVLIGTVGQICLRKGQLDAARAILPLFDRFPQLHWLLIGERHSAKAESVAFDADIDEIVRGAGHGSRLHRLGTRADMACVYHSLDLLLHAARQDPFSRVLLEAAVCSVPIVTTDVGGTREMLTDDDAWIVPARSPDALSDALADALANPAVAAVRAARAAAQVAACFPVAASADRLLKWWRGHLP